MLTKARIRDYGLKPFALLFTLNAVDEFDRSVLAVALDRIREHFDVSDSVVALLPLAFVFVAGVLALPAGTWADRWVRKYVLSAGAVVWSFAGLAAAAAPSFAWLFGSRLMLGAGQGTIGPTHLSLLSDYYPVRVRGRVLGYHRSANPFGQILGAVLGSAIVAAAGWRWGFAGAAIPGLVLGLYALTLREPKRGESDLQAAVEDQGLLEAFLKEPDVKSSFRESLGTIFRIRTLRYTIYANAALGFSLIGVVFWLPAFFERKYGYTTQQAGLVFGLLALGAFTGTVWGAPIADRQLARGFNYMSRFAAITIGSLAIAWPLAFLIPVPAVTIFLLVSSALVASVGVSPIIAVVAACAPPRIRSQAFAAFGLALSVCGAAVAPVMVGVLSDVFQNSGMSPGDGLRYSMLACTLGVMALGTWFIYLCSRTATDDANKTIGDFLASFQQAAPNAVPDSAGD